MKLGLSMPDVGEVVDLPLPKIDAFEIVEPGNVWVSFCWGIGVGIACFIIPLFGPFDGNNVALGAGVVYTMNRFSFGKHYFWAKNVYTLGEKACTAILHMVSQEPSIAKVVVAFNQFYPVAFGQTQLVRASCHKLICERRVC